MAKWQPIGRQQWLIGLGTLLATALGLLWLLPTRPSAGAGFGGGSSAMSSARTSTGMSGGLSASSRSSGSSMAARSAPAIAGAGGMSGLGATAGAMTGSTSTTSSNLLGSTGLAVGPASGGGLTTSARIASGPAGSGPATLGLLSLGQNGLAAQTAPSAIGSRTGVTNLAAGPTSPTGTTGLFGSTGFGLGQAGGGGMTALAAAGGGGGAGGGGAGAGGAGTSGTGTSGTAASGATPQAQALGASGLNAQSAPPVSGPTGNQANASVASGASQDTGTTDLLGATGFGIGPAGGGGTAGTGTGTAAGGTSTGGTSTAPTTGAPTTAAAPTSTLPSSNQPVGGANPPTNTASANPPNTVPRSTPSGLAGGGGGGGTQGAGGTTGTTAGSGGGVVNSLGNASGTSSGVTITAVTPGTLAAEAGFQPGDEIFSVEDQPVRSPQDLDRLLLAAGRSDRGAKVRLRRNGAEQTVEMPRPQLRTLVATLERGIPDGSPGGAAMGVLLDGTAFPRLIVREVKAGSPAALAGLQPGDEIVAVMGQPVESIQQLRRAVSLAGVGNDLRIAYRRGDRPFQAGVPLSSYAAVFGTPTGPEQPASRAQGPALGIRVAQESGGRVVVTAVQADSPAAMAGIEAGDQIVSAQGTPVRTPAELASVVEQAGMGNRVDLLYRHNGVDFRATPRVSSYAALFGPGRTLHGEQPSIGIRLRETPTGGTQVAAIAPSGPAAKAGLQPGDQIEAVNGQAVRSPLDVVAAIQRAGIGGSVQLRYLRAGQTQEANTPVQEFAVAYGMQQGVERQVAKPPQEPSGTPAPPANPQGARPPQK